MIQRFLLVIFLSTIPFAGSNPPISAHASEQACMQEHSVWVAEALGKMKTIQPGMTREQLLKVFTTEGGLSTGLNRRFVSRDCPYFKVDVEFAPVGRPARDSEGRVTLVEDSRDIIVRISQPYLDLTVAD